MKGLFRILLSTALLFGVSSVHATGNARPKIEISKQECQLPFAANVQLIPVHIMPAMVTDVIAIERVDHEVLSVYPGNELVADVAYPVMSVAHGPPKV